MLFAKALLTFVATVAASLSIIYLSAPTTSAKPAAQTARPAAPLSQPTPHESYDDELPSGRPAQTQKARCTKPCCK